VAKRRICIVLGSYYPYFRGGIEVLYTQIFRSLIEKEGWDVQVIVRKLRKKKKIAFEYFLPSLQLPSLRSSFFGRLFEFIYLSFLDQVFFGILIGYLSNKHFRKYDVVLTPDPIVTIELAKRKISVIQFVSSEWARTVTAAQPLLYSIASRIESKAYQTATCTIFMDSKYASNFTISSTNSTIIPNGVDVEYFSPDRFQRDALREKYEMIDKIAIITTSTLRKVVKGYDILLHSIPNTLESNPNVHFYLVGKGKQEWIRSLADTLSVQDNIHLLGERVDIPELLCASDIFLLPSRSEGTPAALLEAMAMEKPCIATLVGNVPRIIDHQKNGLLINPERPTEISNSINFLIDHPKAAAEFGIKARKKVEREYSLKNTIDAYHTLIDLICDQT